MHGMAAPRRRNARPGWIVPLRLCRRERRATAELGPGSARGERHRDRGGIQDVRRSHSLPGRLRRRAKLAGEEREPPRPQDAAGSRCPIAAINACVERLSPDDTRILRLESDVIAGHTLKVVIVDAPEQTPPPTLDLVRRRVQARLGGHRRARQRLAPTPLNVATPAWVDDTSFDIRRHVRLASEPVSDRDDLIAFAGKVMAERLDHSRPLWCIDFAGPLDDGRTALVIRIHHCMADGVTALRFVHQLLWDDGAGSDPGSPSTWQVDPEPGAARLLTTGVGSRVRDLGGAVSNGARAAVSPRTWRETGRELAALPGTLRRELWPLGAETAFDRRIGGDRVLA